jgi:surface antigen
MGGRYRGSRNWLLGPVLAIALPAVASSAYAVTQAQATEVLHKSTHSAASATHDIHRPVNHVIRVSHTSHMSVHSAVARRYAGRTRFRVVGISCVPYARSATGITLAGNAWQWWDHAEGTYERGSVPEPGGVLAFRANGRMRLGHVAVVTRVVNDREIEIDHANWAGGGVAHNVPVVDVSQNNDWSAVRVGLGRSDDFGSIYPTYGFIYDRPDSGTMLTAITVPAAQPALNAPPRDLRTPAERALAARTPVAPAMVGVARSPAREYDEVAETPSRSAPASGGDLPIDRSEGALPGPR